MRMHSSFTESKVKRLRQRTKRRRPRRSARVPPRAGHGGRAGGTVRRLRLDASRIADGRSNPSNRHIPCRPVREVTLIAAGRSPIASMPADSNPHKRGELAGLRRPAVATVSPDQGTVRPACGACSIHPLYCVCAVGPAAGEKRGAAAGWITPSRASNVPRARLCGCSGASAIVSTGATQASPPSNTARRHVGGSGRRAARPVDAPHIGAHIGQQRAAERPGADAGHLDHRQAIHRLHGPCSSRRRSSAPMGCGRPRSSTSQTISRGGFSRQAGLAK